jgi:hypothetical protein
VHFNVDGGRFHAAQGAAEIPTRNCKNDATVATQLVAQSRLSEVAKAVSSSFG